jgi:hypothetical protein
MYIFLVFFLNSSLKHFFSFAYFMFTFLSTLLCIFAKKIVLFKINHYYSVNLIERI